MYQQQHVTPQSIQQLYWSVSSSDGWSRATAVTWPGQPPGQTDWLTARRDNVSSSAKEGPADCIMIPQVISELKNMKNHKAQTYRGW